MQSSMNDVLAGLGIRGSCIRAESHRHLAFFDIALDLSAKSTVRKIQVSAKEIAIHMRMKTVPLIREIPSEGIVRLQAALKDAEMVNLTDLYNCGEDGKQTCPSKMIFPFLLGENDEGNRLWMDMNDCPHLLIAGGTGSGKSTLLHNLIANAFYVQAQRRRNVWLYLSDPKRVEFMDYKNVPELSGIVKDVASQYTDVLTQLETLHEMMESRYKMLQAYNIRSVEKAIFSAESIRNIPLVLCIVDEVADLMMQDKDGKLQGLIVKLAQKGRAAGIFMVLATQRPSVDVITGLIKANFPGRIACKTASRKDSEVILDRCGAETLLGRGDAVLQNMRYASVRFQVAYTEPADTISFYEYIKQECAAA